MLYIRNLHSVGQLYFSKQTYRKKDQICGYQRWGEGELDEGGEKVQTEGDVLVQERTHWLNLDIPSYCV